MRKIDFNDVRCAKGPCEKVRFTSCGLGRALATFSASLYVLKNFDVEVVTQRK